MERVAEKRSDPLSTGTAQLILTRNQINQGTRHKNAVFACVPLILCRFRVVFEGTHAKKDSDRSPIACDLPLSHQILNALVVHLSQRSLSLFHDECKVLLEVCGAWCCLGCGERCRMWSGEGWGRGAGGEGARYNGQLVGGSTIQRSEGTPCLFQIFQSFENSTRSSKLEKPINPENAEQRRRSVVIGTLSVREGIHILSCTMQCCGAGGTWREWRQKI